jgi:NitT/TauT family transport system substrate-binding protein
MGSGSGLFDPNIGRQVQTPHHWGRREFVKRVAALGAAAGVCGYDMRSAAAEPPPETNKIRIHIAPVTCVAPEIVAQELLYAEGFTEVNFVNFPKETQLWPPESFLAGETDIGFSFSPTDIRFIDAGAPVTILAAAHNGCVELVARDGIRSTRDLKGKTVNAPVIDSKIFISMFAAYVGVNPEKDINWTSLENWDDQIPLLKQGKIDAFMAGPPGGLELRRQGIGHVLVNTTTDKPWSQYSCCLVASTKEFVRKYPVATKRALRALLKGVDLCASDSIRAARLWADRGLGSYETTLQVLRETPFGKWREIDPVDSLRFWALRMRDVGAIKSTPQQIIAQSVDLRFLNELKRELKA